MSSISKIVVHICSMFKDSQHFKGFDIDQVGRFFKQVMDSKAGFVIEPHLWLLEGDSEDTTKEALIDYKKLFEEILEEEDARGSVNLMLDEKNRFYRGVKSTADVKRIIGLSDLGDRLLNSVKFTGEGTHEFVLWIESDFIYDEEFIGKLIETQLKCVGGNAVVAPLPMDSRGFFYDTWAFMTDKGEKWTNQQFVKDEGILFMKSIGSCALIPAKLIQQGCRFRKGAFPNLCKEVREAGATIICNTDLVITHPASMIVEGRAI